MAVANALAYYQYATIMAVRSLTVQTPGAFTIKLFTAVMYIFS
jgi:hypothetical protein